MSFSVCMLCNDEADIIDRFVSYYTKNGAREIFVYLDFATPVPDYTNNPIVTVIQTETLFQENGTPKRPSSFHQMQRDVYTHAYGMFSSEWLLICDVDEFIEAARPLNDVLEDVPADWEFFRIPVAEAVWGPEDPPGMPFTSTYFRTRTPKGFGKVLSMITYGMSFRFTNAGLMGYSVGKYFIRKGTTLSLGIHMPAGLPWSRGPWVHEMKTDPEMFVYHFEAISYDRWLFKWTLRSQIPRAPRRRYNRAKHNFMTAFLQSQKTGSQRALFDSVYQLSKRKAFVLKSLGLLVRKKIF